MFRCVPLPILRMSVLVGDNTCIASFSLLTVAGDKMRFLGTDGAGKLGLQPQNTVHQLKRILGKKFQDPEVRADVNGMAALHSSWPHARWRPRTKTVRNVFIYVLDEIS